MNRVVRHAIAQGVRPVTAIQMATLNTAEHFGMERELGSITPGRRADFLIVSNLAELAIEQVYARGMLMAVPEGLTTQMPVFKYPAKAKKTINMAGDLTAADFEIRTPGDAKTVKTRVIGVIENQAPTKALELPLEVKDGVVAMSRKEDVCQIALVERHRATGGVVNGFVSGFGYDRKCAVASTVAHDSHHMIVVGTNHKDMAIAANRLREVGGGVVVIHKGEELALVELPIAGLMSDEPAEIVAGKAEAVVKAMQKMGCRLNNAYMQHSLLALVVIPELRISDLGIIDVRSFEKVDLFVS
jgi:adenine deaminase